MMMFYFIEFKRVRYFCCVMMLFEYNDFLVGGFELWFKKFYIYIGVIYVIVIMMMFIY